MLSVALRAKSCWACLFLAFLFLLLTVWQRTIITTRGGVERKAIEEDFAFISHRRPLTTAKWLKLLIKSKKSRVLSRIALLSFLLPLSEISELAKQSCAGGEYSITSPYDACAFMHYEADIPPAFCFSIFFSFSGRKKLYDSGDIIIQFMLSTDEKRESEGRQMLSALILKTEERKAKRGLLLLTALHERPSFSSKNMLKFIIFVRWMHALHLHRSVSPPPSSCFATHVFVQI